MMGLFPLKQDVDIQSFHYTQTRQPKSQVAAEQAGVRALSLLSLDHTHSQLPPEGNRQQLGFS